MPRDPVRSVRIDEDNWHAILQASLAMGVTVSEVIRFAVADFLKQRDAA